MVLARPPRMPDSWFNIWNKHGTFGVDTWLSKGLNLPRDSDDHVNVGPVSLISNAND